jgi:hypothetical protein
MNNLTIEFITLTIGAAVVPVWIIIVLLLLRSEGGLFKALAFVSGQILVRLAQGFLFGNVLAASPDAQTEQGAHAITSILLLLIGILLLITAALKGLKQEDPDAPPPKWMKMFDSISVAKAFGLSIALMLVAVKQWVFTLGVLGVITEANLDGQGSIVAYLVFVLGAQSLVLVPIALAAVTPKRSAQLLETGSQWLERHNRKIVIGVSVVFGTYFVWQGITGLLS